MSGTTLCPHCNTRFRIAADQLEAHQGMVRCGYCMQAFDARPGHIPDEPHPQLKLAIPEEPAEELAAAEVVPPATKSETASPEAPQTTGQSVPTEAGAGIGAPHDDLLNFHQASAPTLAEQVTIVPDNEEEELHPPASRRWPWAVASLLLLLALLAQAAYFLRVDLAARLPAMKPALAAYCKLLRCSIPLPQKTDLMSIESSDLEADPTYENRIILNALLRNRAGYPQAFPHLELTLSDSQDKPLARRIFKPKDYLPPQENEPAGLLPNHELGVRLHLDTADLRPTGYRLALLYP